LLPGRGGGGGGRGGPLWRVLAVVDDVTIAAVGRLLVAIAVVVAELLQRVLLVLGGEDLLDRGLRLVERLLLALRDLGDVEHVPAELRLHRAGELALVGREDRLVEGRLLLALGHAGQRAALALG